MEWRHFVNLFFERPLYINTANDYQGSRMQESLQLLSTELLFT